MSDVDVVFSGAAMLHRPGAMPDVNVGCLGGAMQHRPGRCRTSTSGVLEQRCCTARGDVGRRRRVSWGRMLHRPGRCRTSMSCFLTKRSSTAPGDARRRCRVSWRSDAAPPRAMSDVDVGCSGGAMLQRPGRCRTSMSGVPEQRCCIARGDVGRRRRVFWSSDAAPPGAMSDVDVGCSGGAMLQRPGRCRTSTSCFSQAGRLGRGSEGAGPL